MVVVEKSLMSYLPYMTASRTSYAHLEQELTTLCGTPGKWIVPTSPAPVVPTHPPTQPPTQVPTQAVTPVPPAPTPAATPAPTPAPAPVSGEDPCARVADSNFEGTGLTA